MHRRSFIRIIGGGVVLAAATVGAAGPATARDMPPESIVGWEGPDADEADPRRWALGYAILAPNPHNLQPWMVDLREADVITLYHDPQRGLPETDPHGRQILIGHGCFLELLVIALTQRGFGARIELFPRGMPGPTLADLGVRPVARVQITRGALADPLFAHILTRRTPKVDFDVSRPVSAEALRGLSSPRDEPLVSLASTTDPARTQALRALCLQAARVEVETERTMMESMRLLRIGPSEINRHRDGISDNTLLARLAANIGLLDRTQFPKPGSIGHEQTMARYSGYCNSAMGFVWIHSRDNQRSTQIRSGRAYVRAQLSATALGLGMHPMSQALQEFVEMRPHHEKVHRLLLDRSAPRHADDATVQMLCRVGYPTESVGPTPRRGMSEIIKT